MNENYVQSRKRVIRRQYSNRVNNVKTDEPIDERSASSRKKCDGLICSICQGPAHGYNFDAITCESCKAFFRRNALKADVGEHPEGLSVILSFIVLGQIQVSSE